MLVVGRDILLNIVGIIFVVIKISMLRLSLIGFKRLKRGCEYPIQPATPRGKARVSSESYKTGWVRRDELGPRPCSHGSKCGICSQPGHTKPWCTSLNPQGQG
ncbi:hypothetical protein IFM89_036596 [Coptis chinensis]|uniref:Uncharacterized protein n=1 Tax=Coptis chinensis TaxID=261450 RepID=A0A835HJK5_9MAGN|nr:hypothetical protein IFM89_036596 [Coptis chinensis]